MTFTEIPARMAALGVNREWLAQQCDYSERTVASILAPNGNPANKTDKALRRIWEALDREEERQKKPKELPETAAFLIRPTHEEFPLWNQASAEQRMTLEQWAIQGLNQYSEEFLDELEKQAAPKAENKTA